MLMPSIFGENLFDDDWMDFPFERDFWGRKNPLYGKNAKNIMKTDIKEHDGGYELDIDLPGLISRSMMEDMNWISIFRDLRKMRSQSISTMVT